MKLRFLGTPSQGGSCPTLFATDRQTYVVQGAKVPEREDAIEIPTQLLQYLETGTSLGREMQCTGRDTFILSGAPVTDAEALAHMDIPAHETCVEVRRIMEGSIDGSPEG